METGRTGNMETGDNGNGGQTPVSAVLVQKSFIRGERSRLNGQEFRVVEIRAIKRFAETGDRPRFPPRFHCPQFPFDISRTVAYNPRQKGADPRPPKEPQEA